MYTAIILVLLGVLTSCSEACRDSSVYCRFATPSQCTNIIVRSRCPARCGACGGSGGGSSGSNSACADSSNYCPYLRNKCSNAIVKMKCRKTCNACNSGAGGAGGAQGGTGGGGGFPKVCGISKVAQSRVINGVDAKEGAWPWQIAMTTIQGKFFCGGSLISTRWIVTASHCIDKQQASNIKIVLGAHNFQSPKGTEQIIGIKRMIMHPQYGRLNNDIALIELDRPAMLNDRVQPICLPSSGERPAVGTKCYLTGWGKIKHPGTSHPILQQVSLTVQENSKCNSINSKYVGITNQMLCAANPGTKQMGCHGDSGGPFVCQQQDGSWKLHGAVSWGSPTCNADDAWTVFARVAEFRPWINSYVGN